MIVKKMKIYLEILFQKKKKKKKKTEEEKTKGKVSYSKLVTYHHTTYLFICNINNTFECRLSKNAKKIKEDKFKSQLSKINKVKIKEALISTVYLYLYTV
jgi:hypothetical protein